MATKSCDLQVGVLDPLSPFPVPPPPPPPPLDPCTTVKRLKTFSFVPRYIIYNIQMLNKPCYYSEHSSQRAKRVANNMSSYGRDMVQNGLGFMHSVSLKSHGLVLLSMKLLPYPVNQSCFPSALDKLIETALRRMVPAVKSLAN